ncbi:HAD family hydrolase [Cellulomonas palmilytica]|uniref:HAD family hydrolase n=1 Tax=Cellulomonas palmilytica TaxID=2608402 RepID=UPI001F251E6A|nr:HAD-IB family hydrolase [Cellulomonas palmilytica]UJP40520.1 HAD-IB family hydrolase [Cellulomonas palmilytica]
MHAIAFVDVDETLLTVNSMAGFLVAYLRERGRSSDEVRAVVGHLASLDRGPDRDAVSRAYYATFAGERAEELRDLGQRWFAGLGEDVWHAPVADELAAARAAGTLVVLVSGAPPATVAPVARAVRAHAWFATRQEERDGVLTGVATDAVVGESKASVARRVMAERGVRPQDCVAYGDHGSDLPMLEAVGTGVVVGDDPVLAAAAARHGWRVLPSARAGALRSATPPG